MLHGGAPSIFIFEESGKQITLGTGHYSTKM